MTMIPNGGIGKAKQSCALELERALCPLHYEEYARRGLLAMGVKEYELSLQSLKPSKPHWSRLEEWAEDLREKANCFDDVEYVKPLMVKRSWFHSLQLTFNTDPQVIRISFEGARLAAFETAMRLPWLENKTNAPEEVHAMAAAGGYALEVPVRLYFGHEWPTMYREADNHDEWPEGCNHDFQLALPPVRGRERIFRFDVWGPSKKTNTYCVPKGKRPTDFHLQCRGDARGVLWESVLRGKDFRKDAFPIQNMSPARLIVYLNCIKHGFDYEAIKRFLSEAPIQPRA